MHREVVLHGSLQPTRRVLESSGESIESSGDDLSRGTDDDRTHSSAGVLAPSGDFVGQSEETSLPLVWVGPLLHSIQSSESVSMRIFSQSN